MRELPHPNAMVPSRERMYEMAQPAYAPPPPPPPESEDLRFDPFVVLRRSLRGRMGWVISISIIAALIFAAAGWFYEKPLYKSEALVRIAYQLPPIINETDQNAPMAMFESYMRTEALRMSSRSVLEGALTKLNGGQPVSSDELLDVASNLDVAHAPGDEHLRVTYIDTDPLAAASVTQAIVAAFQVEYNAEDRKELETRMAVLDAHAGELQSRLDDIQTSADKLLMTGSATSHEDVQRKLLVQDRLGVAEQMLHDDMMQESRLEDTLADLRQEGYLDEHPKVQEVIFSLNRIKKIIVQLQAECQQLQGFAGPTGQSDLEGSIGMAGGPGLTQGEPDQNADGMGDSQTQGLPMMAGPGADDALKLKLERLESDAAAVRKELAETTERTEALKLESAESRLEIISDGDVPLQAFRDRRKIFAGMGGMFGAALPTALLVLLSIVRPRHRYSDEAEVDIAGQAGLLGILPSLPVRLDDPEVSAGAAQCVHQMRVMLQVAARGESRNYLMTSSCSGEGKTSLTMALGLSFAASGSRTLVVDFDMVGRAMTRGLGASDELGLFESLNGGDPLRFVRRTRAGIWFLPAGRVNALYASKVSHLSIRRFLQSLRQDFDVVLIDSGPILGSVEAATVAPEVDGVIVTVTRGQVSALVERTSTYLRTIGARIEGFVFNRAKHRDFHRSTYGSSVRSTSSHDMLVRPVSEDADGLLRFGPLVESVMSSLPEQEQSAA
jgi:succinoglycan biosynthesis transport protein ExoP